MKKKAELESEDSDEMRAEYDFKGGVRGKYAGRIKIVGARVALDEDVARVFTSEAAVNSALRHFIQIAAEMKGSKA